MPGRLRKVIITVAGNRMALRTFYYPWRVFPYPVRRVMASLYIVMTLFSKKVFRVDRQNDLTPASELLSLSFWGVPEMDLKDYRLRIEGAVEQPSSLAFDEIRALPSVTRQVRMDCVGGTRNNSVMKGVPVQEFLDRAGVQPQARRAVFHCADGYYVSIRLEELLQREAFLAYAINDEEVPRMGYPLRLAMPGKYGFQWAKWVVRIELAADDRKGHWARLGLPDRADVGDIWK